MFEYTGYLDRLIKAAAEYEDGESGIDACIDQYCADNGIHEAVCEVAKRRAYTQGALEAGIPLSVIEGKTKLTDHFSQSQIDRNTGRGCSHDWDERRNGMAVCLECGERRER